MKLSNNHITTFARKLFHYNRGIKRPKLMHPKRDWLTGVVVGIVIILVMIGWSAYTYLEKREAIELTTTRVEAEIPAYSADTVADALAVFAKREELFNQLTQSIVPTAEPVEEASTTSASSTPDQVKREQSTEIAVPIEEDVSLDSDSSPTRPESASENTEPAGESTIIN